jgi:hypothetical protein
VSSGRPKTARWSVEDASGPGQLHHRAAPALVAVNDFSTSSALPASRAARAIAACEVCGVAT